MIEWDIRSRTNKIRLRLPVLLGIRLQPKTSDSLRLGAATLILTEVQVTWHESRNKSDYCT